MKLQTKKGYGFFEATSAFQKAIRLGDEETALYFAVEFFNSGYDNYLWRRMKIIVSEDIGIAAPTMISDIQALFVSYYEQKEDKKENRPERLFLVHAVVMLCRAPKSRLIDWLMISLWREHETVHMEVPDYAFDMHNVKGKQMGRGMDHFYDEGTKLENHHKQAGEDAAKAKARVLHKKHPGKLSFTDVQKGTLKQQQITLPI
jgi:replication-associated recombination protein RarA